MGCRKLSYYEGEGLEESSVHFFGQLVQKRGQQKNRIDYYPFGLTFNSFTRDYSEKVRYKFNEYEVEDEIGTLLSEFRMYDPAIGRFWAQDPMVKENISPYAFANNNPILFMDALGLDTAKSPLNIDQIVNQLNELKGDLLEQAKFIVGLITSDSDDDSTSDDTAENSDSDSREPDTYWSSKWMTGGIQFNGEQVNGGGQKRTGQNSHESDLPLLTSRQYKNAGLARYFAMLVEGGLNVAEARKKIAATYGVSVEQVRVVDGEAVVMTFHETTIVIEFIESASDSARLRSKDRRFQDMYRSKNTKGIWVPD